MSTSKPEIRSPNPLPEKLAPLERLVRDTICILDVRAPVEFERGAFPNSINLPILNDEERAEVGTTFKNEGQEAAIATGHRLVSGNTRTHRVAAWRSVHNKHPNMQIMCWRGGLRSKTAQAWMLEEGFSVDRIEGGYKALRRLALTALDWFAEDRSWWVVGGRTGVGKTRLIKDFTHAIDLEGHARHRGSAFGATPLPQPAQATFENTLACAALELTGHHLIVEDEGRTIGRLGLPPSWHERMQVAPLVVLEASLEERVANIVHEYVAEPLAQETPAAELQERYRNALDRITKRLGGERHQKIRSLLDEAFDGVCSHEAWVGSLLSEYYDPMYDYQLSKKKERVVFAGTAESVKEFLEESRLKPLLQS